MTGLTVFNYGTSRVRTIMKNGEPLFVLKDVCDVLELSNARMIADRLDEDDVSLAYVTDNMGREQQANVINESGLYDVILRSDKPEAKKFKKWITSEVLPH
jgi:anti-repressor protein